MSRRVLVIGATGFLGASLVERFGRDHEVLGASRHPRGADARFDFWTDDVADILRSFSAEIVVFAGSVERPAGNDLADSYRAAIDRFLAPLAGARLVYVSSDAVFDGRRGRYREIDPPAATGGYGRNLLLFEERVRAACPDRCIVRSSYLYGFGRSGLDRRLARTRDLLLAGESPEYAVDMFKSPMEIGEVAEAVRTLTLGSATGTVHISGPRSSVFDFHTDAMAALGLPADRLRRTSLPENSTAPRDTSLDSARMTALTRIVPRSVKDALSNVVAGQACDSHGVA